MDKKIKDRKSEIEFIRMALNTCEIGVSYNATDLILRVIDMVKLKGGETTLLDSVTLHQKFIEECKAYTDANKEK